MTEARVGFLCNLASCLQQSENTESSKLLRSYYLMRCKEVTGGYGLPTKHFSPKVRCPHCCLEWSNKTDVKIKPIRPSKRQNQRLKLKKAKPNVSSESGVILQYNQMEQICSFCNKTTVTTLPKPQNMYPKKIKPTPKTTYNKEQVTANNRTGNSKKNEIKKNRAESTMKNVPTVTNVYSNAFDVFSLKNEQNTLASAKKGPPKIKNNKKRKDKFAGLCQKAVLASAKLNQDKIKQNKLSLFLKPSSG